MRYLPQTSSDISSMLETIGVKSVDDLFSSIPKHDRFNGTLNLPPPLSEGELFDHLHELGRNNRPQSRKTGRLVFAGAGLYRHHIPAAIDALSLRGEFATAYTPYQPELSQGTLLGVFEFQTMIAELLGMEVANASMYDGASATAEALLMAHRLTGRKRILISQGVHPEYVQVCQTMCAGLENVGHPLEMIPIDAGGKTAVTDIAALIDDTVACVIVQTPNFFGTVEDLAPIAEAAHQSGALLVAVCTEPLALSMIQSPGTVGADIGAGEGISLASPPNLGGPGVGFFAATGKQALRQMPGRLAGQTVDADGRTGYVLTLSTREQHIRREKATSNICTNTGLYALRLAIHLSLLGKSGFQKLGELNFNKSEYAKSQLSKIPGVSLRFGDAPTFNEFAIRIASGDAERIVEQCSARAVVPGVALGRFDQAYKDTLLIAVNETHRRDDIDHLCETLKQCQTKA